NRWLFVEFIPTNQPPEQATPTNPLDGKKIYNALKQSILTNFGDTGWGAVGLSLTVKYFSPMTNVAIIRVGRDQHRIAWGGITLMKEVDNWKFIPYVVHVSGTIKHAQLAAITHNREVVARFRAKAKLPANYKDSYTQLLETSEREIDALQD
ncbi:Ribonucleases P/MRP protein subunit POP5, partial [Leucoagaricus sp. SymC.cos]